MASSELDIQDVGDGSIELVYCSATNDDEIYVDFPPPASPDPTDERQYFRLPEFDGFSEPAHEELVLQTTEEVVGGPAGVVEDGLVYIMHLPDDGSEDQDQLPLDDDEEEEAVYNTADDEDEDEDEDDRGENDVAGNHYGGTAGKNTWTKENYFHSASNVNDDDYSETIWMTQGAG